MFGVGRGCKIKRMATFLFTLKSGGTLNNPEIVTLVENVPSAIVIARARTASTEATQALWLVSDGNISARVDFADKAYATCEIAEDDDDAERVLEVRGQFAQIAAACGLKITTNKLTFMSFDRK